MENEEYTTPLKSSIHIANKTSFQLRKWIPYEKINWAFLSFNPNAIDLLEKYPDKIDWWNLSTNTKAIHVLEKYQKKIDYIRL